MVYTMFDQSSDDVYRLDVCLDTIGLQKTFQYETMR